MALLVGAFEAAQQQVAARHGVVHGLLWGLQAGVHVLHLLDPDAARLHVEAQAHATADRAGREGGDAVHRHGQPAHSRRVEQPFGSHRLERRAGDRQVAGADNQPFLRLGRAQMLEEGRHTPVHLVAVALPHPQRPAADQRKASPPLPRMWPSSPDDPRKEAQRCRAKAVLVSIPPRSGWITISPSRRH